MIAATALAEAASNLNIPVSGTASMSVASGRLKIAVFERPPYSFKDKDGNWTGLSIDLWEQIAGRLGLSFDYVETPLSEVYVQLQSGACDLSPVIPLSQEKAGLVDFTEPYLFSHGAVVIPKKTFLDTLKTLHSYIWSREVFIIFLAMLIGMTVFSFLLMLVERKHVSGHFSGPSMKGLGSALWFSAVTMTTVGYGDKTPLSVVGRLITFFWMLVGVLLIALFTGTVASSITTAQIQNGVVRFDDLSRFHLGCLEGSRMDFLLRNRGIPAIRYTGLDGGFEGFKRGEINAYAGDSVTLEYWMTHNAPGKFQISLIPDSAMIYAFATRHHLPQLSEINRELLEIALAPDWRSKAERWTGPLSF